jgi:hypothetical protein
MINFKKGQLRLAAIIMFFNSALFITVHFDLPIQIFSEGSRTDVEGIFWKSLTPFLMFFFLGSTSLSIQLA